MEIKNNLHSFKNDIIRLLAFLTSVILCGYHVWQYIQFDSSICILRIAIYGVTSLTILLLGMKALYFILIILALLASYFNSFVNFTGFFVVLLACRMNRRSEYWLLTIYGINESVALMYQGKDISHLLIHLLTCLFFYVIYFYINKPKALELKEDEELIIKELAAGKLQKEIDIYSKNIIKEKLDHAKIRNHIASTEELVMIYKQSHC